MLQISSEFKQKVATALLNDRNNYGGSDASFAKKWSINKAIFSRIKKGEIQGILSDAAWLNIGSKLDVTMNNKKWKTARTDVFNIVEEEVTFCKEYSKSLIIADECGIGKSHTAKYLSRTLPNCFYIDCKQAKSTQLFVRTLARTIGVDSQGRFAEVKQNLKYYLSILEKPVIIADDAGYLRYQAYMELLELIDATENVCGWYQIGDDSLREKIERGINSKKVGYRAMFSRNGNRYTSVIPTNNNEKLAFYKKMLRDVLAVNAKEGTNVDELVMKCIRSDNNQLIGDLRRAESVLRLSQ
jgi:hypothetical protein